VKKRYLAPNAFTATSLLCGLASIVMTIESRHIDAAWFALWCVLLDKVDGFAARLLHAQSRFGAEFDSFADQVAFGIAPAVLFLGFFTEHPEYGLAHGWGRGALLVAAGVYVIANAARLARFNITESDPRYFTGLPTTLCGGVVCAYFLVCLKYGAQAGNFDDPRLLGNFQIPKAGLQAMPLLLFGFGLLMVSGLRIPKLTRRVRRLWNSVQTPGILLVYVLGIIRWLPEYMLFAAVMYSIIGLWVGRKLGKTPHAPTPAPS
jgi:CDP-diacylglycerol---serine O-phosphatidyltransferase